MGSGLSGCISITGPLLLMQFHLVVLGFFFVCFCAFLPLLCSPRSSPAILQCPLSNGIKWSTKCAQGVTTMSWGWGNIEATSGCWAFRASPASGREGAGEEPVTNTELLRVNAPGEAPAPQSDLHSTQFPVWDLCCPVLDTAKQVLPKRSPCGGLCPCWGQCP